MPEIVRCPGCGHPNPAGRASCESCNFPLEAEAPVGAAPGDSAAGPAPAAPPLLRRPRRPPRPMPATSMSLTLWLVFGVFCAAVVLYYGVQGFVRNNAPVVEGSTEDQQKRADQLRAALDRDSTNVDARLELANLLYDTANWSEAIVHYRAAIARDSTRIHAIVDLGVCYFNLGDTAEAEKLFRLALARDPHQPVALFNLGIVSQQRNDHKTALGYFHRALMSNPPEEMKKALMDAMQRSFKASGATPPPITDGR